MAVLHYRFKGVFYHFLLVLKMLTEYLIPVAGLNQRPQS